MLRGLGTSVVSVIIKMGAGYQLLIVSFLLLLENGNNVRVLECGAYDRPSSADIKKCIQIEEVVETALLSNKNNLHILRDTFLSSSHPSPHFLDVFYHIIIAKNESEVLIMATWTISKVFTVIDPDILHNFQSGIMTLIYYAEGILFPETIDIYLNISGHQYSEAEYLHGILIITQRVSL